VVSVILPTYNRHASLDRAISSVLAQSFSDLELIVIDDGSTDETAALIESQVDSRIRHIRLPMRTGAAAARNVGIRAAMGSFFAFQDSDDEWLPEKLALQVSLLVDSVPEVGWVGGSHIVVASGTTREVTPALVIAEVNYELDLLDGQAFVTPTWLVRRESLFEAGLFSESMTNLEDWDLIFRLDDVCQFRAVAEPILVRYGSHDSLFGDIPSRIDGYEHILRQHNDRWSRHPAEKARCYRELGWLHHTVGSRGRALRCIGFSVLLNPRRIQTLGLLAKAVVHRTTKKT
jgi:glycosyltransferase involved in cell wall biosynthesis